MTNERTPERREYKRQHAADKVTAANTITPRPCADPARRKRLEADPEAWLAHYLAPTFYAPFGAVHREMIDAGMRSFAVGGSMAVAAPRGEGKTQVLGGLALYGVLTGRCRFPVVAGFKNTSAKALLRGWINALGTNERLAADYPEVTQPFEQTDHAVRLRMLRWEGGDLCGTDKRVMDGVLVLPDALGAFGAVSINGSARGLFATMPNGETLRPDVLFLDDPQDKKTAKSPTIARETHERIKSDLFNLAGPQKRLAIMAAVTVIEEGDVAEKILDDDDFESIRRGQIVTWPDGFHDDNSDTRALWDEWNMERVEGKQDGDEGARARAFYLEHKAELTAGMAVSWAERYDKKRGDPDAMFAAMWDFYRQGEAAFMSERQNQPMRPQLDVYDLKPEYVAGQVYAGRKRYQVPEGARVVAVGTDINHYGLHSVAVSLDNAHTGSVIWYGCDKGPQQQGIVPKDCPLAQAKKLVFAALVQHGTALAAMPLEREDGRSMTPGLWLIDGGYMPDVVRRFIEGPGRNVGMPVAMYRGYAYNKYRPEGRSTIGSPREQTHRAESAIAGQFVAANADYWRETWQRALLPEPGSPGGLSLHDGAKHDEFAEQLCREKLMEKLEGDTGTIWVWHTAPGWHDYADAMSMCYVAGVWMGIGTQGARRRRGPQGRRKAKVPIQS